jgi:hypothetical protein
MKRTIAIIAAFLISAIAWGEEVTLEPPVSINAPGMGAKHDQVVTITWTGAAVYEPLKDGWLWQSKTARPTIRTAGGGAVDNGDTGETPSPAPTVDLIPDNLRERAKQFLTTGVEKFRFRSVVAANRHIAGPGRAWLGAAFADAHDAWVKRKKDPPGLPEVKALWQAVLEKL